MRGIVVPKYTEIDDVFVTKIGLIGDFVKVIYLTKNRIKMSVAREIEEETISLYKLLSPDELDDLFIQFESVDDEEN